MKEKEIKAQWDEFRKYIIQKHHLLPDYEPDLSSIVLWEEYKHKDYREGDYELPMG